MEMTRNTENRNGNEYHAKNVQIPSFEPESATRIKLTSGQSTSKKSTRRAHRPAAPKVAKPNFESLTSEKVINRGKATQKSTRRTNDANH